MKLEWMSITKLTFFALALLGSDILIAICLYGFSKLGQLLRYARISTHRDGFVTRARELISTLLDRGFDRCFLIDQFFKFANANRTILLKYRLLHRKCIARLAWDVF